MTGDPRLRVGEAGVGAPPAGGAKECVRLRDHLISRTLPSAGG